MERDKRDYKPYTVKWIGDNNEVENWLVDGTQWDMTVMMARDKADGRSIEIWTRVDGEEVELMLNEPNSQRREELASLDKLVDRIMDNAKAMVDDYTKNPSDASGEVDVKRGMVKGDGIEIDLDKWEDEEDKE
tara:strand:+ start:5580 stop:5978 length:399 start_codon:yes stop_codon:yes gene_type:complete